MILLENGYCQNQKKDSICFSTEEAMLIDKKLDKVSYNNNLLEQINNVQSKQIQELKFLDFQRKTTIEELHLFNKKLTKQNKRIKPKSVLIGIGIAIVTFITFKN